MNTNLHVTTDVNRCPFGLFITAGQLASALVV
jgi:hypothetical protein